MKTPSRPAAGDRAHPQGAARPARVPPSRRSGPRWARGFGRSASTAEAPGARPSASGSALVGSAAAGSAAAGGETDGAPAAAAASATGSTGLVARGFADQFRDNVRRLGAAQKSGHGVPPYTRYVNRPLGRRLAAIAAILRLTPNAVTGLSMLASYLGMALFCLVAPHPAVGVGVGVLMLFGYALDSADGQLARLTGRGGPAGEWVDHVSDQARTVSLHMAVLIWLYRFVEPTPALYLLPMAWAVVVSTRFLGQILGEQFRRAGASKAVDEAADRLATVRAWLQLPSDNGVICAAFLLSGTPETFLWAYGVLLLANALLALVSLRRRYVELRPRVPRRTP